MTTLHSRDRDVLGKETVEEQTAALIRRSWGVRMAETQHRPCIADGCRRVASFSGANRSGAMLFKCACGHTFAVVAPMPRARSTDPERVAMQRLYGTSSRGPAFCNSRRTTQVRPLTADEIDVHLFSGHHTAARRLPELAELGLVHRSTDKRPTRAGRAAFIWRAMS